MVFADVLRAASVAARHPRLRADMEAYIEAVFACAADVMTAYEAYKREHGLIDFSDQLCLALEILRRRSSRTGCANASEGLHRRGAGLEPDPGGDLPRARAHRAEEPWVGDPKQAIYGFRSTDTALTLNASLGIAAETGGKPGVLAESFRSRPGIVSLVNDMFVPAFVRMGLPEKESSYEKVRRKADPAVDTPLSVWHFEGRYPKNQAGALAVAVADMLANRAPGQSARPGRVRPLRARRHRGPVP